jgi:hypothetical protein
MWVWSNGAMAHTTTSTTIPSGATSWSAPLDNAHPSFSYTVPNVLGTYSYNCSIHPTLMSGSFTVVSTTAVSNTSGIATISCTPNPANNNLHVVFGNISAQNSVTICDLAGREVISNQYNTQEADIDVSVLPRGFYFLKSRESDGALNVQKIEIAR